MQSVPGLVADTEFNSKLGENLPGHSIFSSSFCLILNFMFLPMTDTWIYRKITDCHLYSIFHTFKLYHLNSKVFNVFYTFGNGKIGNDKLFSPMIL